MYNRSMPRPTLLALFTVATLAAQPDTVTKVADGVWMREGDLTGKGHCNNAVIEMKDYLIVVDANFPNGAEALMADIKKLSPKPVKYVLLTHHHGDHAYGSAIWTRAGATTVAHIGVKQEMDRYEPKRWQGDIAARPDVKAIGTQDLERPRETFDKSPWVATDGTRRVEFWNFGWGHTRGDGYVYLPKEKVLIAGDAIVNGAYNFTADGNLANWPRILSKIKRRLPVTHVVPGHGRAGGPEVLDGQIQFLQLLRSEVAKAVKSGKKLEDLVTMEKDQPKSAKMTLPDSVKNWVGNPLPSQIRDAYREVTAKKPAGDLSH
jgi:glyoxylase-like metal-dependent hydrolase (beta-lactamase superfamily II)